MTDWQADGQKWLVAIITSFVRTISVAVAGDNSKSASTNGHVDAAAAAATAACAADVLPPT